MKLSVSTTRVVMVGLNIALAIGLLIHYSYSMWPDVLNKAAPWLFTSKTEVASVEIIDPASLVETGNEDFDEPPSSTSQLSVFHNWVQPKKIPVVVKQEEEPVIDEPRIDEGSDEPIEGGPLAEKNWEYATAMLYPNSPERSIVMLRQKAPEEDEKTAKTSSTRTRTYGTRRTPTVVRSRGTTSKGADDPLWLKIARRHFVDEERELDFFIHSADPEELVYWTKARGGPKTMYVLKRAKPPGYWDKLSGERRVKLGDEPEEEEGKPKLILRLDKNYKDQREKHYQEIVTDGATPDDKRIIPTDLKNRRAPSKSSVTRPGSTPSRYSKSGSGSTSSSKSKYSKSPSSDSGTGSSAKPKTPEKKATIKDLNNTINDIKSRKDLTPKQKEDLKQLDKLQKDLLGNKKR